MGLFEHFPYTNFHELNIHWITRKLKELETELAELKARMDDAEARLDAAEDEIVGIKNRLDVVEADIADIKNRLTTAESNITTLLSYPHIEYIEYEDPDFTMQDLYDLASSFVDGNDTGDVIYVIRKHDSHSTTYYVFERAAYRSDRLANTYAVFNGGDKNVLIGIDDTDDPWVITWSLVTNYPT